MAISSSIAAEVEHHEFTVDSGDHTACLECHDAIKEATNAGNKKGCDTGVTASHPTGTNYPPIGKEKLFNSREFITEKGILLSNGKVTCLSCHNLRTKTLKHLSVSNIGSQLCLTCHHT